MDEYYRKGLEKLIQARNAIDIAISYFEGLNALQERKLVESEFSTGMRRTRRAKNVAPPNIQALEQLEAESVGGRAGPPKWLAEAKAAGMKKRGRPKDTGNKDKAKGDVKS